MKIVLLPLDERPCNYVYPRKLPLPNDVFLLLPPSELMSKKKNRGDIDGIREWLLKESLDADYLIVSLDTLLFGGIVPSRIHNDSEQEILKRSEAIRSIKKLNPKIKIYAFEVVMRCPSYSFSDEEPLYFDEYGSLINQYGVYLDKKEQGLLSKEEEDGLDKLAKSIDPKALDDFISRREKNKNALFHNLELLKEGVIDYFIIPQDDSSQYGFPAREQRKVREYVKKEKLGERIIIYPGADEVGMTLIARALNDYRNISPSVYVLYATEKGKKALPLLENRPVDETIENHIKANKSTRSFSLEKADVVLMVNLGSEFLERGDQRFDLCYKKERNLELFERKIKLLKEENRIVGVADIAYMNEGDLDLIKLLEKDSLLFRLDAYAGWNTSSNSLGTVLASLISYHYSKDTEKKNSFLLYRYVEDVLYMSLVRNEINKDIKGIYKSQTALNGRLPELEKKAATLLEKEALSIPSIRKHILSLNVVFPWNRTFELELKIKDDFQNEKDA